MTKDETFVQHSSSTAQPSMSAVEGYRAIQKTFLSQPFFAVVGASKDETKYGTKVCLSFSRTLVFSDAFCRSSDGIKCAK